MVLALFWEFFRVICNHTTLSDSSLPTTTLELWGNVHVRLHPSKIFLATVHSLGYLEGTLHTLSSILDSLPFYIQNEMDLENVQPLL